MHRAIGLVLLALASCSKAAPPAPAAPKVAWGVCVKDGLAFTFRAAPDGSTLKADVSVASADGRPRLHEREVLLESVGVETTMKSGWGMQRNESSLDRSLSSTSGGFAPASVLTVSESSTRVALGEALPQGYTVTKSAVALLATLDRTEANALVTVEGPAVRVECTH